MAHIWRLAINKKSTIFIQSSWNLVKMITSWANHFHQVSWGLDKNCRFFINGQFLKVSRFFPQTLNTNLRFIHQSSKTIAGKKNVFRPSQTLVNPPFWWIEIIHKSTNFPNLSLSIRLFPSKSTAPGILKFT